jgi:hypothetical protein
LCSQASGGILLLRDIEKHLRSGDMLVGAPESSEIPTQHQKTGYRLPEEARVVAKFKAWVDVNIQSASSQARPAPKPRPTQAGQARRLNRRTEKTTPKDRPREDLMIIEEMARSHYGFEVGLAD